MSENNDFDTDNVVHPKVDIATTIELLTNSNESIALPAKIYYGLSHLDKKDAEQLQHVWNSFSTEYRRKILTQLTEFSENDIYVDYREIAFWALHDSDPDVQVAAIELLWEDESLELLYILMNFVDREHSIRVRGAALKALGRFLLLGEYDELPQDIVMQTQNMIVNVLNNEASNIELHRQALEAISYSSHPIVNQAIRNAYNHGNHDLRVSAIFAMGKSCDPIWEEQILDELDNPDAEIRYEAARASGELELDSAVSKLGRLLIEDDREITEMAIWSLGEIGGREAIRILESMAAVAEEQDDDDLLDSVDEALENANFSSGLDLFADIDLEE